MRKQKTLDVIRGRVDLTAAIETARTMAAGAPVIAERSVLYPYLAWSAHCKVPTIAGDKCMSVNCLVDGVNGFCATADSFITDPFTPSGEVCLEPVVTRDEAGHIARRTVTHRLGKKLKMIAPFGVKPVPAGTVYKRFWIVRIGVARIMIDGVTGRVHPLKACAA